MFIRPDVNIYFLFKKNSFLPTRNTWEAFFCSRTLGWSFLEKNLQDEFKPAGGSRGTRVK